MKKLTITVTDINDTPIEDYKYIINLDNTGDPFDPDPSKWPSLKPGASSSPVIAVGDSLTSVIDIPEGKYLVTIRAEGYKLGGTHVNITEDTTATIKLYPHPLPLCKIRVHVFHDNHPVNGEDDVPQEQGLEGFHIVIDDAVGEVTVDYFSNVLGTEYQKDVNGNLILDGDGKPIPIPGTGGKILTDIDGNAIIEYIAPGKYEVQAIPPNGSGWIQTSTIEGTHSFDVWVEEGNDGYSHEEGFIAPLAWFGFVRPMDWGEIKAPGTGLIKGTIRNIMEFAPPAIPLNLGEPVDRPWIALTDIGDNDQQVFTGRGNPDGTFEINNVPDGLYQMAIWDEPLDYIISFRTVEIRNGAAVNMGDIGIPRWFGWIKGTVFRDINADGIQDPGEEGIPMVEMDTRFKDGSIQYNTITNTKGGYSFNQVFELEHFAIAELGFTRFGYTGAKATPDFGTVPPKPSSTFPRVLLLAEMTWAGTTNKIDWGLKEYPLTLPDNTAITNGGITGIIYYATMRNEHDPRFALAEDYEPGIPGVALNLYKLNNDSTLTLVNATTSDAWTHPINCVLPDGSTDPACTETPRSFNQIKPGVFDGGFAFEEIWVSDSNGNPIPDPENPGEFLKQSIPEGTYIVEIIIPNGYQIVDENSVNTSEGDVYSPNVTAQLQNIPVESNLQSNAYTSRMGFPPYYQDSRTMKVVELGYGMNASCNFFLYTYVPIPGRIVGLASDDLNIETDPNSILYGEKRGIPYLPIGIRDFKGKLITTVHTDKNGTFEILLPSTYTANVPKPSGVALGMYRVIGNDPGDPDNPNAGYNPDYHTLPLVFEVWPGKTTYADVALFPTAAFAQDPNGQFLQPPQFVPDPGTPVINQLDVVYINQALGDDLNLRDNENIISQEGKTFTIYGENFAFIKGKVTLDGMEVPVKLWTDTRIVAYLPASFHGGAYQLLIHKFDGKTTPMGITFHVLNDEYAPNVIEVMPDQSIQAAIDKAVENSLIVIHPGLYYENIILYKNVKLQGMGANKTIIDGRFFASQKQQWTSKLASINFDGPQVLPEGQVITVVAKENTFNNCYNPQIDGLSISGARGQSAGGIFINAYGRYLEISNNIIKGNGGGFGGAITIGRAYSGDNFNKNIQIHHNHILYNGGVSLAGAIGLYNGSDGYEICFNEIFGNYSAEYGGGISHFGYSPGGKIHHNRIRYNGSFDEGAGIFIGGEKSLGSEALSKGSGEVDIFNNFISENVANDDGGGIRLLEAGNHRVKIFNNFIVNNASTDLGGGIALDDSSKVIICNNTIAKNTTTATAEDSDRKPHGAGLVSEANSPAFQKTLPPGSRNFSDPVLFNNIFWDNRAYHFDYNTGALAEEYQVIDMEVFGTPSSETFSPYNCYLTIPYVGGNGNIVFEGSNPPEFVNDYTTKLSAIAFNMQPDFISIKIISGLNFSGDYHIAKNSPVINKGVEKIYINGEEYKAPKYDYDNEPRKSYHFDIGADEVHCFDDHKERDNTINLLLASIAFEELGLAHLINAESEKIQSVLGTLDGQNVKNPSVGDLERIDKAVELVLADIIKEEMLLQLKLENIMEKEGGK